MKQSIGKSVPIGRSLYVTAFSLVNVILKADQSKFNNSLMKLKSIGLTLLLLAVIYCQQCPSNSLSGGIISDSLTFGAGNLSIQSGINIQCYTYNFQSSFQGQFFIAVATNGLQGSPSTDLSYYVRPVPTNTFNSITFQVKTPWKLTQWSQFSITFIAETRNDLEAGNRIVDTAFAGGCGPRTQTVYLPYAQNWPVTPTLTTRFFLNGFTASSNNGPVYSLRINSVNQNSTGLIVTLTVGGTSQIDIIYASYVVFDSNVLVGEASGNVERNNVFTTTTIQLNNDGLSSISNFIYGVAGFEWNSNNPPSLNVKVDTNFIMTITITSNPLNYISIQYVLLQGSCSNCQGYPYQLGQSCVQNCGINGYVGQNNQCVSCQANSAWSGNACICVSGFYNISGTCQQCSPGTQWNGVQCTGNTFCGQNAYWNSNINQCQCNQGFFNISGNCGTCPPGTIFSNGQCVPFGNPCSNNAAWVNGACQCNPGFFNISGNCGTCPIGTTYSNGQCVPFGAPCPLNAAYVNGICQCNQGFFNISGSCTTCPPGSIFSNGQCVPFGNPCPPNAGYVNGACQCNAGLFNISGVCSTCPPGSNFANGQCLTCPPGSTFSNGQCISCPANSALSNGVCQCNPGFNNISGICGTCAPGSTFSNGQCVPFGNPCSGNAGWVNGVCQCNPGFYNISGTCGTCPLGSNWNGVQCVPFGAPCPANSGYVNSVCQCNPGFYNISGVCTTCPPGTNWNGNQCVQGSGGGFWYCPPGTNCIMFCNNYPNTVFDSSRNLCVCRPNTFFINGTCQACPVGWNFNGVTCVAPFSCPPNSIFMSGMCICVEGFRKSGQICVPNGGGGGGKDNCPDNYYYSSQEKKCLVCTQGCARCSDSRTCLACSTGFSLNSQRRCSEVCGDGVRFVLACDDGNRINGDGCSSSCRVESGWTCFGGSPNSRDYCSSGRPSSIAITPTGQTHSNGKVNQNFRVSWLPANLTTGNCSDCLEVRVISGPTPASITSNYVPGTSYSFNVGFDYGYEPIPDFKYQVRINPKLQNTYFPGIDIGNVVTVNASPNLMAMADEVGTLSLTSSPDDQEPEPAP